MKRFCALLLLLVLAAPVSGCSRPADRPAEPVPTETAAPVIAAAALPSAAPEPTKEPAPPPTAEPTATPVPTPAPTPEPRWVRGEETVAYTIFNGGTPGAQALTVWLLGTGREGLENFGGETHPFVLVGADRTAEVIPAPRDDTRHITLCADERLAACGLLAELLPAFEAENGYIVEVVTGEEDALPELCREAEIAILAREDANAIRPLGLFETWWPYISTDYVWE